jgi:hypothetical protein
LGTKSKINKKMKNRIGGEGGEGGTLKKNKKLNDGNFMKIYVTCLAWATYFFRVNFPFLTCLAWEGASIALSHIFGCGGSIGGLKS